MFRLTIFKEGQRVAEHDIARPVTALGRHTDNDVVLDDLALSRFHARLEERGAQHVVVDLGSQNGTYVNGTRVDGEKILKPGDRVGLGRYVAIYDVHPEEKAAARLNAQEPHITGEGPSLLMLQHGQEMERFPLTGEGFIIGRSQRCDIVIGLMGLSRRHARVYPCPEGWLIEDLGSQNGTYINERRIDGPTLLAPGDAINFFEYQLVYQDHSAPQEDVPSGNHTLESAGPRGGSADQELLTSSTRQGTLEQVRHLLGETQDGLEEDLQGFEQNRTEMEAPSAPRIPTAMQRPLVDVDSRSVELPSVDAEWPSEKQATDGLTASMQLAPPGIMEVRVDNKLLTEVPVDRAALRIGADARCDVALPPLTAISPWHLVVIRVGNAVLMSRVGDGAWPRIRGVAVAQAFLQDGDRIQLGRVTLVYRRH